MNFSCQLFAVTCDNASSVVKAFKITNVPLHRVGTADIPEEEDIVENDDFFLLEQEDDAENQTLQQLGPKMERNGCLAHLTQLVIKDAITQCEFVNRIIKRVNELVTFFHRSNHYYTQLKRINGNRALVKPCVTRWNSQYSCLQRIVETTDGIVSRSSLSYFV